MAFHLVPLLRVCLAQMLVRSRTASLGFVWLRLDFLQKEPLGNRPMFENRRQGIFFFKLLWSTSCSQVGRCWKPEGCMSAECQEE